MREGQEFQEWDADWTQEQDDRLRAALGALRHDVDGAGIPDVRFVMRRAGRQRHRAVAGIAAGAAAVLGLSWLGYQSLDDGTTTAPPAGTSTPTTERDDATELPTDQPEGTEAPTDEPSGTQGAALVAREDLVLAESGGPPLDLFVPPTLWESAAFTDGAATSAGVGEFESTSLVGCDTDDVMWGAGDEGTFGVMGIWSGGSAFAAQRVRVLDSADAAAAYVNDLDAALASCTAPAEADNITLEVQPLELPGAHRITTTFEDGTDPITNFYYVVQHDGTPEAASTFRLTDWSEDATDAEAVAEFERLAALVTDK